MKARRTKNARLAVHRLVAAYPRLLEFRGSHLYIATKERPYDEKVKVPWRNSTRRLECITRSLIYDFAFTALTLRHRIRWFPDLPPLNDVLRSIASRKE